MLEMNFLIYVYCKEVIKYVTTYILLHLTDAYSNMKQRCLSGLRTDFKIFVTFPYIYRRGFFEHNLGKLQICSSFMR